MSKFIPEIGEERTVKRVVEEKVTGFINCPPAGTRMRATLGESVIVGTVHKNTFHGAIGGVPKYSHLYLLPEGSKYDHLYLDIWLTDGWELEVLDTEAVAA